MATPTSTGIGAPGTAPAPANLGRSPMASQPSAQAAAIPFTRGSTLATMKDFTASQSFGTTQQYQLQTNAFLESLILDVAVSVTGNSASVVFGKDAPWTVFSQIRLDDPAGQSIIAPISGFQLYLLNIFLSDTDCNFDPTRDPGYTISGGSASTTAGSFEFRLVVPIEHRKRDALGALNNSAANQRYLLTITTASSASAVSDVQTSLYTTAPTTPPTTVNISCYQQYWTSPPATITSSAGSTAVQATPAGLGTVAFVRSETHNEVNAGGTPQIQLSNVGDIISNIIWILRTSTNNQRDQYAVSTSINGSYTNWPTEFDFLVNDYQTQALSSDDWTRWCGRFYGLYSGVSNYASGLTNGTGTTITSGQLPGACFPMFMFNGLFDTSVNFGAANQYLPTDATTKLQVRGSTFGSGSTNLQVLSRLIRPVSGAALYA